MAETWKAPVRGKAQPGPGNRSASAAGNPSVSRHKRKRHGCGTTYAVTPGAGEAFRIVLAGRDRWALEQLLRAGTKGCTPMDTPAPRWSAYVHKLRTLGLEIVTLHEAHGGDFAGHHGRYVLRSAVMPCREGGVA